MAKEQLDPKKPPVKQEPTKDQTTDKPKPELPAEAPKKPTVHDSYPGGVFMQ